MKKLEQKQEGRYYLERVEVIPELVYGPVCYKYQQVIDCSEIPIDGLIKRINLETGVDLGKIANSFHSGGITVVPDPLNFPDRKIRHEIVFFYNSRIKPVN